MKRRAIPRGSRKRGAAKKAKADELFSKVIRTRDRSCRACGSTYNLQCAHIESRRYHAIRWSEDNAVALCQRCHMKFTHDPIGWRLWVRERLGAKQAVDLERRALVLQKRTPQDYGLLVLALKARLEELT